LKGWGPAARSYEQIYEKYHDVTKIVLEMVYSVTERDKCSWCKVSSLREAVDVAFKHHASYLIVWKEDIANLNPNFQNALKYAASHIGL